MDVSPLRLAGRLHQANAKVVVRHTHPHAASPRRRVPLKPRAATGRSAVVGPPPTVVQQGEGAPETGTGTPIRHGGQGSGESQLGASDRLPPQAAPNKDAGDTGVTSNNAEVGGGDETVESAASPAGGDSAGGGVPCGRGVASGATESGSAAEVAAVAEREEVSLGDVSKVPTSEATNQDALAGAGADAGASASPLPGPSPAGMSPVWTFEGRTPSNKVGSSGRAIGDSRWTQSKMWMSNPGHSSGGASTPTRGGGGASLKALVPEDRLREKRRALQRRRSGSMESMGHSVGSTAPTGTSSSMRGAGAAAMAAASKGKAFTFPVQRGDTDSESDDQLAVRASAFEGGGSVPHVPMPGPSGIHGEQWAMEMQMEFAQERRRWEE